MRNPKWLRDEIILALDLYFDKERGSIDKKNPRVVALSKLLNQLPLVTNRPDAERFRNENGVTLKLSNFKAVDPDYHGKGMKGGSKLDEQVFNEFRNNLTALRGLANRIREAVSDAHLREQLSLVEEDDQTETDSVPEGQTLYKLHKLVERNRKIITQKKDTIFGKLGRLECEACSFEFASYYGEIGQGYIECHHRVPLASFGKSTRTSLDDLALVCSNCHRMLHRRIDTITVEHLRDLIRNHRIPPPGPQPLG